MWDPTESGKAIIDSIVDIMSTQNSKKQHFKPKDKTVSAYKLDSLSLSRAQLCLTLCNPMHCSPPGSSGYGIFQARILGCYFHLQSIFPTQVLKLHLLHWQANSLPLNHQETGLVSSNLASDSFTWTVEVKCISICTVLAQSCFIYAILKCAV